MLSKRQTFYKNFRKFGYFHHNTTDLKTIEKEVPGAIGEFQALNCFWGLWMAQNQNALILYDTIFKHFIRQESNDRSEWDKDPKTIDPNIPNKIGRIIEIGSQFGGLSVLFHIFSIMYGCDFYTYDIEDPWIKEEMDKLNLEHRKIDVFKDEERLGTEISSSGATILLCDGGNKIKEFNTFSKYLKSGDIILAHDYAPDHQYAHEHMKNNIWSFTEITYADIEYSVEENNLEPFMFDLALSAATACFMKKEEKSV